MLVFLLSSTEPEWVQQEIAVVKLRIGAVFRTEPDAFRDTVKVPSF